MATKNVSNAEDKNGVVKNTTAKKTTTTKKTTQKRASSNKTTDKKSTTKKSDITISECKDAEKIDLQYPFVGYFEKVPFDTFASSFFSLYNSTKRKSLELDDKDSLIYTDEEKAQFEDFARAIYDNIKLPERNGNGSSEYHFTFPFGDTEIEPNSIICVPTGIRCYLSRNWMLKIYPEQFDPGMSIRLHIDDSTQIVNPDDYANDQIYIKLINDSKTGKSITIGTGSPYAKGVFEMYGLAYNEFEKSNK